ncbi:hypothetical protein DICTH_0422 [Dictyoglomus thermophilum H-6-12]|uniref:Uncharacterized protein n=1 Tax=Dictyoglomus thermophilum (strain ATCC 35947 / DSM 3960 / H-6-12) TaxID=309799 RepID=B5YCP6_DICT6|nr:hypothetical protein DICTH_0422 [Dictyoglomus thermophilum H-6-12]
MYLKKINPLRGGTQGEGVRGGGVFAYLFSFFNFLDSQTLFFIPKIFLYFRQLSLSKISNIEGGVNKIELKLY